MMGISFLRILRTAGQNFWRNIWLSLATLFIMIITLLMMSMLYFANVFGAEVLRSIEKKVDLSVTFKDGVSQEAISAFAAEIESREDVDSIRIISSEEALELFKQRHQDDPFIEESLQELEDNPLPASLYVVAVEPRFYQNIARQLEAEKYTPLIEKVNYENSRSVIEKLIGLITTFKQIAVIITVIFALLAVLIMFNTVRLAIYSFREEIDIMRLVGASNWFIRGPFVIESIMIALLAVVISTLIIYPSLHAASSQLERFFFDQAGSAFNIYQYALQNWLIVIGLQLGTAVTLAVISSMIGIRRYLRSQ